VSAALQTHIATSFDSLVQLVPAVTELIIAEMLYLQYKDRSKPIYLYINSTGTTRADGETVGFETEGTAIFDTMSFIKNEVGTLCSTYSSYVK
jgi:ATP-dependent protease ClpP protease subunit